VVFASDVLATGELTEAVDEPLTLSGSGYVLTTGNAVLDGVTIDGLGLLIRGSGDMALDNIVFEAFGPTDTQLTIEHAGRAEPFAFSELDFQDGTGTFIAASAIDGGTGAFSIAITSPDHADGPARTTVGPGVTVSWGASSAPPTAPITLRIVEEVSVSDEPRLTPVLPPLTLRVVEPIVVSDAVGTTTTPAPISIRVVELIVVSDDVGTATTPAPLSIRVDEPIAVSDTTGSGFDPH
jgi:hypothetical protein